MAPPDPPAHPNQVRGRWGEDLAADWYVAHRYQVVARNWRCPIGELDLVVRRRRLLVVVEVKARRTRRLRAGGGGRRPGQAAAHPPARRRVAGATGTTGVEVRFDVVAVTGTTIEVIEAAF